MPPPNSLASSQERLFRAKLRSLSVTQFKAFAAEQGWTPEQAWEQTWTDVHGHRWSTLSRLGYLLVTDNRPGRHEALLAEGLRHHGQRGLARQTEPGEPDLLWAWLGYNNLNANVGTQRAMDRAFLAVSLGMESGLATGLGLRDDGGWVDRALALLELHVEREGTPLQAMRWWENWIGANLLDKTGDPQRCWWDLGRGAGWTAAAKPPSSDAETPTLPWSRDHFGARSKSRPAALANVFSPAWARLVRLGALLLRHAPERSKTDGFPCGIGGRGDLMGLTDHLGPEAWAALADFLRAAALERPNQAASGAMVEATNLWLTGPRTDLSPGEELALAKRLALPQTDLQPGEPEGSVADWSSYKVSPALRAWLNEQVLQAALQETAPTSPVRPRARM